MPIAIRDEPITTQSERLREILGNYVLLMSMEQDINGTIRYEYMCRQMPENLPQNCEVELILKIDRYGMEKIDLAITLERGWE